MRIKAFIKQCHNKGVFKMLSIYAFSSWILLQLTSITSQPLGLPDKSVTYLILALLVGLPFYILYVWKVHVVIPDNNEILNEDEEGLKLSVFRKIYFSSLVVISVICLVAIFLIINKNFQNPPLEIASVTYSDKIAVLQFGNNTGDPAYDIISKMAADWIMHGITKNNAGQVISSDVLNDYSTALRANNPSGDQSAVAIEYLKPGKVISGNFYLKDNKLLFQSVIKDGKNDETLIAFKTNECNKNDALDCIDDLKESILGFLLIKDRSKDMLEEIPKYDAYKYVLEAKNTADNDNHIALLNKAIVADPDYFEPKVLRVAYYYNTGDYFIADSLLKNIKPDSRTNKRQLNILNTYQALLAGNNRRVYTTVMEEYAIAPFDLQSNKSAMAVALQFVNRPEVVTSIYNAIPMDSLDLQNCMDCMLRLYVKALADVEMIKYHEVIIDIERILEISEESLLQKPLIAAYVRSGNHGKVSAYVNNYEILNQMETFIDLSLYTASEYLLLQNTAKANEYLDKVVRVSKSSSEEKNKRAQAFYLKNEYSEAVKLLEELQQQYPDNIEITTQLVISYFKLNNTAKAQKYISLLEALRGPYQYGSLDYAMAQIYAAKEDKNQTENYLKRAVAEGLTYTNTRFQNDPHFIKYKNAPFFNSILTYWH